MVVQLSARFRRLSDAVEVADVLTRLFDDPRVVGAFSTLVAGDHYIGVERFDGIKRTDPLLSLLEIRLGEVEVDVVVGDVSGNNQPDRGDVQNGGAVGVAMSNFDGDQFFAFELEAGTLQRLGDGDSLRDLAWEEWVPERGQRLRRRLQPHVFDDIGSRDGSRVRKTFADDAESEPVVAVTMGDIHRGQVLAGGRDPVSEGVALLEGHERVDQHSVTLTGDECGGAW